MTALTPIVESAPDALPAANEAIAVFNRAGEALSRRGLKFFYHTHGYEFQPHGGGTLFYLMMAGTKNTCETPCAWMSSATRPFRSVSTYTQ